MRARSWQVTWRACPQPDGWSRLHQAVRLVIDHADARRCETPAMAGMAARDDRPQVRSADDGAAEDES
jgi:hypothetical protein